MKPVRILLADDHDLLRRGLRTLLETRRGWKVVGEAADGSEAVEKARRLRPDVVVMDIGMPERNGLEATREILRTCPGTEVVILTMHESEQAIREVVAAGARGYISKADTESDLVAAVEALSQHRPFFTQRGTQMMLDAYRKSDPARESESARTWALTPRQREIVQLLAEGKSNKEVAATLGISVKTAETHRTNIMHRLGFSSLSQLIRYAIRNRIVDE